MPRDVTSIDLGPIKSLIALILERCKPVSVWLWGSRAKGTGARRQRLGLARRVAGRNFGGGDVRQSLPLGGCVASPR